MIQTGQFFFHNCETKTGLNKLEGSYFQAGECSNIFQIPVIINSGENMSSVIRQKCESSNEGNKETQHTKFSRNEHFLPSDILWYALLSCYLRFKIGSFALSATIWSIIKDMAEVLPISNHEKVDTRLIFHSGINN